MRLRLFVFALFFPVIFQISEAKSAVEQFDKVEYYRIVKSGNISEVEDEIQLVQASASNTKDAFTGTLLMKKAGLLKVPKQKLSAFKSGRIKFETSYRADTSNVEFHFLRLIIQEHAPKVVKYSSNIADDAAFIKKNYKNLSSEVRNILIDYSQTSKALKPQDFEM